jgi:CheY-like chemotaxis protein
VSEEIPSKKVAVMLVLGDPKSSAGLAGILRDRGFDVVVAQGSADAAKSLQGSVPDIVMVDLQLEREVGGFELMRRLRQDHPSVRVVAGSTTPHWFAANSPNARIPVVMQPYDLERLVALLRGDVDPGATPGFTADDNAHWEAEQSSAG